MTKVSDMTIPQALNPPYAPISEGNTGASSTSITSISANGTVYNVVITPIKFLGTKGPACQAPISYRFRHYVDYNDLTNTDGLTTAVQSSCSSIKVHQVFKTGVSS